ncbi:uncharacterized protein V6R79_016002 [Siganus canaliculatus]
MAQCEVVEASQRRGKIMENVTYFATPRHKPNTLSWFTIMTGSRHKRVLFNLGALLFAPVGPLERVMLKLCNF